MVANNTGGRYTEESLSGSMRLKDIGIDSLKFIVMILEIETRLGRKIFNVANLAGAQTLDDLTRVVIGEDTVSGSSS
jgi:acyl carrier protein